MSKLFIKKILLSLLLIVSINLINASSDESYSMLRALFANYYFDNYYDEVNDARYYANNNGLITLPPFGCEFDDCNDKEAISMSIHFDNRNLNLYGDETETDDDEIAYDKIFSITTSDTSYYDHDANGEIILPQFGCEFDDYDSKEVISMPIFSYNKNLNLDVDETGANDDEIDYNKVS